MTPAGELVLPPGDRTRAESQISVLNDRLWLIFRKSKMFKYVVLTPTSEGQKSRGERESAVVGRKFEFRGQLVRTELKLATRGCSDESAERPL